MATSICDQIAEKCPAIWRICTEAWSLRRFQHGVPAVWNNAVSSATSVRLLVAMDHCYSVTVSYRTLGRYSVRNLSQTHNNSPGVLGVSVKSFLVLTTIVNREARACRSHESKIESTTLKGSPSCIVLREWEIIYTSYSSTIWIIMDYFILDLGLMC